MNLFRILITAGVMAVSANAAAVPPKQEASGDRCYLIGTADELEGFAAVVNGGNTFTGCAKLTADIHYLGNAKLLNDDRSGVTGVPAKKWTPLQNFAGTFDGQDYTIYGLYASSAEGGSFIKTAMNSADFTPTIRNLHIADSYFDKTGSCKNGDKVCYGSAGLVSLVSGSLTIDKGSFSGTVASTGGSVKNGGLIGVVAAGSTVSLINSYNEGRINGAGLVGDVVSGGSITVNNCYNVGSATASPLMGARSNQGAGIQISGTNLGCVANTIADCNRNFARKNGTGEPVGTFVSADPAAVIANYWTNIYGGEGGETSITNKKNQLVEDGMAGLDLVMEEMEITYLDPTSGKEVTITISVPVAKIKITLDDNQTALVMPENLDVYGVIYEREFATASSANSLCNTGYNVSTSVLPFTMNVDSIVGGTFYKPTKLYKEDDETYWTVGLLEVTGNIEAHQPYIVCPTASQLTFKGSTIVKQTDGTAGITEFNREPIDPAGTWKLVGLYRNKTFSRDESIDPDAGREYAFSKGQFLRMMAGSSTILRAYLLAPEGSSPSRLAKAAAGASIAEVESAPSQIQVKIIGTDYEPFEIASIEEIPEGNETEGEGTLGIKRPLIFPMNGNRSDSWTDIKGRSMNRKPSTKGVYLKNGIPAVAK